MSNAKLLSAKTNQSYVNKLAVIAEVISQKEKAFQMEKSLSGVGFSF